MDRIQSYLNKLSALQKAFEETTQWSREELTKWHTESIALFEVLNVNEFVLEKFVNEFGSVRITKAGEISIFTCLDSGIFVKKPNSVHQMTVDNAFLLARKKIELMEEEEQLVPSFVKDFFQNKDKYGAIFTALGSIEKAIRDKNIESLMSSSNTLLNSALDNVAELQGSNVGEKLKKISEIPAISSKISMDKEVLIAINNSRVIRNSELIHPKRNIRQTIPYICAISYAYLVVHQLKIMLSVGIFEE